MTVLSVSSEVDHSKPKCPLNIQDCCYSKCSNVQLFVWISSAQPFVANLVRLCIIVGWSDMKTNWVVKVRVRAYIIKIQDYFIISFEKLKRG